MSLPAVPNTDRKVARVRRLNIIRSQIRHQGFGWWLLRRIQRWRLRRG